MTFSDPDYFYVEVEEGDGICIDIPDSYYDDEDID